MNGVAGGGGGGRRLGWWRPLSPSRVFGRTKWGEDLGISKNSGFFLILFFTWVKWVGPTATSAVGAGLESLVVNVSFL